MTIDPKRLAERLFGKNVRITDQSLTRANYVFSAAYAVQALAVILLSKAYYRPLQVSFLTDDALQSQLAHHSVSAFSIHQLLSVNIALLLGSGFFALAVFHLVQATLNKKSYNSRVRQGRNGTRWAFFAVAYIFLLLVTGMLAGVADLATWLLVAVIIAACAACCIVMEILASRSKRKLSAPMPFGWAALILAYVPIAMIAIYVAASNIFGNGHVLTAYLYSILAVAAVCIAAFGVNAHLLNAKRAAWREYAYGELWYMLLGVAMSAALCWQIFSAVLRP